MNRFFTRRATLRVSVISALVVTGGITLLVNACSKPGKSCASAPPATTASANHTAAPVVQNNTLTQVVTVGDIRKSADGSYTTVYFHENEEIFMLRDQVVIGQLQEAYNSQKTIRVTYNPWTSTVLAVADANQQEVATHNARTMSQATGYYTRVDVDRMDPEVINNAPALAEINTTTANLVNVVPDMATAQAMFDYITHQCCALPGPYRIDHCIPFQYCEDGCYARAHKMCWIINNTYHYSTHKIFSFAVGGYSLSVKAEKWGGCCINWWYHVAPLVNIKTPSGVKAYVFDPAMFDQPVLLATWLHAQQNPACSGSARVTSINIQPTSSYSPYDTSHFDTDPTYSSTNSTLMGYAPLTSCP
jgi:Glutaminase